ncbi:MAG: hypothetical protein U1E29_12990, partial [Coriobacteriia bacterium]|nr:hypothetical protein [Coriobacteriia bacterium]
MGPVALTLLALVAVAVVFALASFERLVKRQHEVAHEQWVTDGRPPGFLWAGEESSIFNVWSRERAEIRVLFTTPRWIADDPTSRALRHRMRVSWIIALASWAAWWPAAFLGL